MAFLRFEIELRHGTTVIQKTQIVRFDIAQDFPGIVSTA